MIAGNKFRSQGPLVDLIVCLYALPIFWLLGLEQFIWPFLAVWLLMKSVTGSSGYIRTDPIYIPVLILVACVLVSIFMIEEGYRYITYIRNSSLLISSVIISFVVYQWGKSHQNIHRLLAALVCFQLCLSLSGTLAVLGISFEYKAPLSALTGGSSGYLEDIFNKSFIQAEALWFREGFFRPKGMMLYANILAGATASLAAIKFYLLRQRYFSALVAKVLYLSFATDAVVFFATLSRSAWLGLIVAVILLFFTGNMSLKKKLFFILAMILAVILAFIFGVDELVYSRAVEKGHSNNERLLNYQLIWLALTDSPSHFMFGYGTQRDVIDLNIPLGSHSTYLGYLYKYGVIAFVSYLWFIALLFFRINRYLKLPRNQGADNSKLFARCVGVSFSIIFVQSLFIEVDVDAVYQVITWVLVGATLVLLSNNARLSATPNSAENNLKRGSSAVPLRNTQEAVTVMIEDNTESDIEADIEADIARHFDREPQKTCEGV